MLIKINRFRIQFTDLESGRKLSFYTSNVTDASVAIFEALDESLGLEVDEDQEPTFVCSREMIEAFSDHLCLLTHEGEYLGIGGYAEAIVEFVCTHGHEVGAGSATEIEIKIIEQVVGPAAYLDLEFSDE